MNIKQDALVLFSGVIGGVLGYAIFFLLVRQGLYGLVLPGGLVGVGAGIFRTQSKYVAIVCGLMALGLGIFTEWRFAPFLANNSFGYFLAHIHQLKTLSLIMIALGAAIGFWVPFRRTLDANRAGSAPRADQ